MFVSEETGKMILDIIEELIAINKTQNKQIDKNFREIIKMKEKLRQVEQIIDNYHGTIDWSPFDRFEDKPKVIE